MSRLSTLTAVAILIGCGFAQSQLQAGIVAQTGFNATSGINPADYTNGAQLVGKGTGEPGWTNTWQIAAASQPYYVTTSAAKSEGDLSLKINTASGSSTVIAGRHYTEQTGVFYVDTLFQVPSSLSGLAIMYLQDASPPGTASMVNLATNHAVNLSDRTTDGNYQFHPTGSTWTAGQWVRVTQQIDVASQTYRAWINGEPAAGPPDGAWTFRNSSAVGIDRVQLFLQEQTSSSYALYVDEFRVLSYNPLTVIALTGFEASSGYVNGQSVIGQGADETGWTSPWRVYSASYSGDAVVQSDYARGGTQAMRIRSASSPATQIIREYEDQNGSFRLDFDVMIDKELVGSPTDINAGLFVYLGDEGLAGPNLAFHSGGHIIARDGNGAGGFVEEDTGFSWLIGQWTHVTAQIDIASQTYEVWIDGQPYNAPDPLGFRNTVTQHIDDIRFLFQVQGANGASVYVDNLGINVPEPSSLVLLASAMLGLLLVRRRAGGPRR